MQKALGREAAIWKSLRHPSVLPFLGVTNDIEQFPGSPCLVMLWAKYGNLSQHIQVADYTESEVHSWVRRKLTYLKRVLILLYLLAAPVRPRHGVLT